MLEVNVIGFGVVAEWQESMNRVVGGEALTTQGGGGEKLLESEA